MDVNVYVHSLYKYTYTHTYGLIKSATGFLKDDLHSYCSICLAIKQPEPYHTNIHMHTQVKQHNAGRYTGVSVI